jgi:hypothetical protein
LISTIPKFESWRPAMPYTGHLKRAIADRAVILVIVSIDPTAAATATAPPAAILAVPR